MGGNVKYKYENLLKSGYKRGYLTKQQHNDIFKYRQIKWNFRYEYYYNEQELILHRFYSPVAVILETITFPLSGLQNFREHLIELRDLWQQKKRGSFTDVRCPSFEQGYKLFLKNQKG
jgi:hypothetical protein